MAQSYRTTDTSLAFCARYTDGDRSEKQEYYSTNALLVQGEMLPAD